MATPLPSAFDFAQIADPSYSLTLSRLKTYYGKESWWGYQPVIGAFADIVSKADCIMSARSTCEHRGHKDGRPNNAKVAELIFKHFEGRPVKAARISGTVDFRLREDKRLLIRPSALLQEDQRQSVAVLLPRVEPPSSHELAFFLWLIQQGLSVTQYAYLPIDFYVASKKHRVRGKCGFLRGFEIDLPEDKWCMEAISTFLRAYDYLEDHPEERPTKRPRTTDTGQGELFS